MATECKRRAAGGVDDGNRWSRCSIGCQLHLRFWRWTNSTFELGEASVDERNDAQDDACRWAWARCGLQERAAKVYQRRWFICGDWRSSWAKAHCTTAASESPSTPLHLDAFQFRQTITKFSRPRPSICPGVPLITLSGKDCQMLSIYAQNLNCTVKQGRISIYIKNCISKPKHQNWSLLMADMRKTLCRQTTVLFDFRLWPK